MSFTKHTTTLNWNDHQVYTWQLQPKKPLANAPTIVMMHGAGTADSTRAEGMANVFADMGLTVISLDFVGHGQTGGSFADVTLKRRTELAEAVIAHWASDTNRLILCGFSMSGHTVLRLTERLGERVHAISVMAPGIYAKAAEDVPFTTAFSEIIRVSNSWQDSLALEDARRFSGKVHIVMSNHDQVIPWGVPEHLLKAFREKASEVRFEVLAEPDHKIAVWLSQQPERCQEMMRYLLS